MNEIQTFQQFLATKSPHLPIWELALNLFLAAVLSYTLSYIYIKYGSSLSNRRMFAKNFMLITITTMLVIAIVKSSLALSLGLVGALSIVRFRAAIKEPEELAYLFIAIAIGLGFGANQGMTTTIAFGVICGIVVLRKRYHKADGSQNLYLTISSHNPKKIAIEDIEEILNKHCSTVDIRRFDETNEELEGVFLVEFENFNQLLQAKSEIQKLSDSIRITFLDNKGLT